MGKNAAYAAQYAEEAKEQMRMYGIPASVILAQAILESSNGQSQLSRECNNHFGIKATASWLKNGGEYGVYTDDRPNEKFCKYKSVGDSYEHHSQFLKQNKRYAQCFTLTKSNGRKDDEGKPLAMAGFPYHALDTYLPKLIRAGERVAICDQLEMPKQTTSSKRGITEMVSPGKETGKQMAQESQETEQHTSLRR